MTEDYDRTDKFANYRRIPSLKEYVLVSHRETLIEVFRRKQGDEWERTEARTGASVALDSLQCRLDVNRIYAGIAPPPAAVIRAHCPRIFFSSALSLGNSNAAYSV